MHRLDVSFRRTINRHTSHVTRHGAERRSLSMFPECNQAHPDPIVSTQYLLSIPGQTPLARGPKSG